jgi:proteasome beta subunit
MTGFTSGKPPEQKTGTTTVGLVAGDGVVLAADRRASVGGGRFVTNKDATKIEQVHPTAALTIAGSVGGAQSYLRSLRAETSLYENRRGEPMDVDALATMASNMIRGLPVHPILAGVDATGPHLYTLDSGGGVMEDRYAATGSGMQLAYGVLEGGANRDLTLAAAEDLALRAVESATERDTASGNGATVARITGDGVTIEEIR